MLQEDRHACGVNGGSLRHVELGRFNAAQRDTFLLNDCDSYIAGQISTRGLRKWILRGDRVYECLSSVWVQLCPFIHRGGKPAHAAELQNRNNRLLTLLSVPCKIFNMKKYYLSFTSPPHLRTSHLAPNFTRKCIKDITHKQ